MSPATLLAFPQTLLPSLNQMSEPYEEIFEGENFIRQPPAARHEQICTLLHQRMAQSLLHITTARLLMPRSVVQISTGSIVRPDLTLVTVANNKPWLVAEIVNSGDHRADTVLKKDIYEQAKIPRLWMIDPRYDNVEVYHGGVYGLSLRHILAGRDKLTEGLLPELAIEISELFG